MFLGNHTKRKALVHAMSSSKPEPSGRPSALRLLMAVCLTVSLIAASACLSACGKNPEDTSSFSEITTEDTRPTESIAQVGTVPDAFGKIIEEDRFRDVDAFSDRLMKEETTVTDGDGIKTSTIYMMDLYGEVLATYEIDMEDAYGVTTVTATQDGGFLFAVGFNGNYIPGMDQIDKGYFSRIIKCDAEGEVLFNKKLDSVEIGALKKCIEKDGCYYFFGEYRSREELKNYGRGDVYILVLDETGNEVNQRFIGGSSFEQVDNVDKTADGFVLEVASQSDDGDFAGSDAGYHEVYWRVVINDDLEILEKEIVPDRFDIRIKIGEKDGEPLYSKDEMFADFDAGGVRAYIDYGDTYLIVSRHQTGQYEHTPAYVSSIWYYWETVYSMYDKSGTLVFRASVDSSPDYSKYEKEDRLL